MPDPDVEIRGVGKGRSSRPLDKGGGGGGPQKFFFALRAPVGAKKKGGGGGGGGGLQQFFLALRASVWSKNKGGGGPPGPFPGSASGLCDYSNKWYEKKLHFRTWIYFCVKEVHFKDTEQRTALQVHVTHTYLIIVIHKDLFLMWFQLYFHLKQTK